MAESKNLLQSFKESKSSQNNLDMQEARRLVNLYRSLSCFGSEFVDKYNQMLLKASPGVRRLFRTFMGGEEVADYFDFLRQKIPLSEQAVPEKEETSVVQNMGYLPSPNEDDSTSQGGNLALELEKMKKQQQELMSQVQRLMQTLKQSNFNEFSTKSAEAGYSDSYSEIIEESSDSKGGK